MTHDLEHVETLRLLVGDVMPDPHQPRRYYNQAQEDELLASYQLNHQLVPILVYREGTKWIIVDGERRWRCATSLGHTTIEAKILPSKPTPTDLLIIQLTANGQRSDLHPLDRLEAFKQLLHLTNWKAAELATKLSISKPTVSRILSLDRFSDEEKLMFRNGAISTTEAYSLSRLSAEDRRARLHPPKLCDSSAEGKDRAPSTSVAALSLCLGSNVVRVRGAASDSFDELLAILKQLVSECRKAKREGIDPKTLARILEDKSQPKTQETV